MQYALVDGERQEARSGLSGECPVCGASVTAKCGDVRVHHWAHRGRRKCDPWWEKETEWHRAWKECFPRDWREIVHRDEDGDKHIADVKTDAGWVLEFQHSRIDPGERTSREAFYQKMIWIVDGTRRKRDPSQFEKVLKENGRRILGKLNLLKIFFPEESVLLREWSNSRVSVFFDFSGVDRPEDALLWCLIRVVDGSAYVAPFPVSELLKYHSPETTVDFAELLKGFDEIVKMLNIQQRRSLSMPPQEFQRQEQRRRLRRRL